jgi:penicillin-binding protein 2
LGAFNLCLVRGRELRRLSNKNCIRLLAQPGARGNILDAENNVIIDNKVSFDLAVLPQAQDHVDRLFLASSGILENPSAELIKAYRRNFIASSIPVTIARDMDLKKTIALEELKFDFPGIVVQQKPLRNYPYGRLGCHVAGYINEIDRWRLTRLADYGYKTKDLVGFGGVEENTIII